MLELLRSSLGSWVSKVFIGLLVASFALWGVADYATSGGSRIAITVGETKVGIEEYQFAFDRQVLIQSRPFGRRLTNEEARAFGVDSQVLSQLVSGAVLDESAREMNLGLSNTELASLIGADRAFQDASGQFNRRIFERSLANAGLRQADYIEFQKEAAIRQQMAKATTNDVKPPKVFYDALKAHSNEARKVSYITLTPELAGAIADPSDDVLSEYFEENKPRYRAPEYRTIVYLAATAEALADTSLITADQVKEEYAATIQRYTQQAERSIDQVLVNTDELKQKAETALAAGGDFDAVVLALGLEDGKQNIGTFTN